jgi:hypothetical protein
MTLPVTAMMITTHPWLNCCGAGTFPPATMGFKREVRRAFFGPGLLPGWQLPRRLSGQRISVRAAWTT